MRRMAVYGRTGPDRRPGGDGSGGSNRLAGIPLLLALLAGSALAGCGPETAAGDGAPAPDTALSRLAGELVPEVERSAGLTFRRPPNLARTSLAALERYLSEELREQLPAERARAVTAAYARLGLLPDTLELRPLLRSLYLEQVIGYYDPEADTLYVREEVSASRLEPVVVHELVHALQDQHMDLDSLMEARATFNDAGIAARAAAEGHATFVMVEWELARQTGGNVDLTRLPDVGRLLGGVDLSSLAGAPALAGAPRLIRESLLFPYIGGLSFVQAVWREREERPAPLGDDLPASSEQILHPDRYLRPDRDAPTSVTFPGEPDGGWSERYADGLGEVEVRLFLEEFVGDTARAHAAAVGWDGDRYRLLEDGSGREALVWGSVWDSPAEAEEFAAAAREAFRRRYGSAGGDRTSRGGEDREVTIERLERSGRPLVRVVDVPAGVALPGVLREVDVTSDGGGRTDR